MKSSACYAMTEIYLDEICDEGFELGLFSLSLLGPKFYFFVQKDF